jgi:hypothetical protein
MAPEQAEGLAEVGPPADVHALGVILYRLLTGQVPFDAPSVVDLLYKVCHEQPMPLRRVCAGVPAELERICLDCLDKAPEKRPTAAALAGRLERFLAGSEESTTALPRPAGTRPLHPTRRRVLAAGLAGAAIAGLGGLGLWLWPPWQKTTGSRTPAGTEPVGVPPPPLTGELIVRVWSPAAGKKGLRIGQDDGAVPLCEGEQVQMEVKLNQPAHCFLLVIDGKGAVTPLYPWNDATIEVESVAIPPPVKLAAELRNPSMQNKGWTLDATPGLDTILLLARRTPWPAGRNLATLLGKVSGSPLRDPGEVAVRGWDRGQPVEGLKWQDVRRGVGKEAREIDDQLLRLAARLAGEFEVIRAVQFAHVGKGS